MEFLQYEVLISCTGILERQPQDELNRAHKSIFVWLISEILV